MTAILAVNGDGFFCRSGGGSEQLGNNLALQEFPSAAANSTSKTKLRRAGA